VIALIDAALGYARRRWPVFPLGVRSKLPMIARAHPEPDPLHGQCRGECGNDGHGFYDATTDEVKLRTWWMRWPEANVGIRTGAVSGLGVIDLDPGKGGATSFTALSRDLGPLPPTREVETGSQGRHVYLQYREGVTSRAGVRPGIDLRGDGGYVVAPPSVHPNGRAYAWIPAAPGVVVVEWPDPWFRALVAPLRVAAVAARVAHVRESGRATPYGRAALRRAVADLGVAPEGTRDDARNRAAYSIGRLVAGGHVARDDAQAGLLAACDANGLVADLGEDEVLRRISRGLDAGIAAGPRGPAVTAWAYPEASR
jgi:hypothetical protein